MFSNKAFLTLLLFSLFYSATSAAQDISVAYVQVSRLLAEPPQVKQVRDKLQSEFAARDERLNDRQRQIQALQDKLTHKGAFMSTEEVKRLERDILSRSLKLKHARKELQQQRQLRQDDEVEHLRKIIREVIAEVAQEEHVSIVLESGALWVSPKIDITEKVLIRLKALAKFSN
jgi:outer membrane protein